MTSAMDDAVGVVLEKVRELGQEENTLIFFISDNGAPNASRRQRRAPRPEAHHLGRRHPRSRSSCSGRATCRPARSTTSPSCSSTCCRRASRQPAATVDPAWKLDGVNLLPYLSGENSGRPHETLYWRIDGMWAIRHGDWKLVHGKADEPRRSCLIWQPTSASNTISPRSSRPRLKNCNSCGPPGTPNKPIPSRPKTKNAKAKRVVRKRPNKVTVQEFGLGSVSFRR